MKEKEMVEEVELPEGTEFKIEGNVMTAKGSKGESSKRLFQPKINVKVEGRKIVISAKNATKREKTKIGTFKAHIKNLVKGANEGFVYRMKICSGHFPMNVSFTKEEFSVKNFLGEKAPRVLKLKQGVDVKIEGDIVVIESNSKELAGQTAADIERLTKIKNRDLRVFQDGIYITEMAGRKVR